MTVELETAIVEVERAIDVLRASGCKGWVSELQRLLVSLREADRYPQKEALFRIGELCHPRVLGDVYVSLGGQEWSAQLERLHAACAKAFNRLEAAT
jgi:hypothetical protein